jgi:hypothetical protein
MRIDKSTPEITHYEDSYYVIEEYQSRWNRWMPIADKFYLKEYEFGQHTACGACWQETRNHGIYDLEYAKKYCNALNDALAKGTIKDEVAQVTKFRIVHIERVYKHSVVSPDRY